MAPSRSSSKSLSRSRALSSAPAADPLSPPTRRALPPRNFLVSTRRPPHPHNLLTSQPSSPRPLLAPPAPGNCAWHRHPRSYSLQLSPAPRGHVPLPPLGRHQPTPRARQHCWRPVRASTMAPYWSHRRGDETCLVNVVSSGVFHLRRLPHRAGRRLCPLHSCAVVLRRRRADVSQTSESMRAHTQTHATARPSAHMQARMHAIQSRGHVESDPVRHRARA